MPNEPIRHHYIPQFILRNFCFDEQKRHLFYYSKEDKEISVKSTRDIFMEKNFYRSEILNEDDPTELEKEFAVYETEIARLIREKILGKEEIVLTKEENESLSLFLALITYRGRGSYDSLQGYGNNISEEMLVYQPDGKILEFWKRNLANATKYRSAEKMREDPDIDLPMKENLYAIAQSNSGTYFTFLERRGPIGFVIGDRYPLASIAKEADGTIMTLLHYFPLTPNLLIALVAYGATEHPSMSSVKKLFRKPLTSKNGTLIHTCVKIYAKDVLTLNKASFDYAKCGVASSEKAFIESCHKE